MNWRTTIANLALLALSSHICAAGAACIDPKTLTSGYKLPLDREVRSAQAIVIGRVLSARGLQEDPTDPGGDTAYDVTIQVLTRLKGNLPDRFVIRNENTSSRYPVAVGEEHVLFVSRDGQELRVDSCGNSAVISEGKQLLKQIQIELQQLK